MSQRHPDQNQQMMFVTTNCKSRVSVFSDDAAARIAVESLYKIQHFYPFFLFAFVIMPDHCHLLLNVPEGGSISKIIGVWKRATTFNIGRGPIWQPRFHIKIPKDSREIIRYIHQNPVRENLCEKPENYSWSSASGKWDVMQLDYWDYL